MVASSRCFLQLNDLALNNCSQLDGATYVLERRYDPAGRLLGITYPDGDAVGTPADPLRYDGHGRLTSIPGILNSIQYDASGHAIQQNNFNRSITARTFSPARGILQDISTTSQSVRSPSVWRPRDPAGLVTIVNEQRGGLDVHLRCPTACGRRALSRTTQGFVRHHRRMTSNRRLGTYLSFSHLSPSHAPTSWPHSCATTRTAITGTTPPGGDGPSPGTHRTTCLHPNGQRNDIFAYDSSGGRIKLSPHHQPVPSATTTRCGRCHHGHSVDGLSVIAKRASVPPFWIHMTSSAPSRRLPTMERRCQRRAYRPLRRQAGRQRRASNRVVTSSTAGSRDQSDLPARSVLRFGHRPFSLAGSSSGRRLNAIRIRRQQSISVTDPSGLAEEHCCDHSIGQWRAHSLPRRGVLAVAPEDRCWLDRFRRPPGFASRPTAVGRGA
jgi:hypothetical protein